MNEQIHYEEDEEYQRKVVPLGNKKSSEMRTTIVVWSISIVIFLVIIWLGFYGL